MTVDVPVNEYRQSYPAVVIQFPPEINGGKPVDPCLLYLEDNRLSFIQQTDSQHIYYSFIGPSTETVDSCITNSVSERPGIESPDLETQRERLFKLAVNCSLALSHWPHTLAYLNEKYVQKLQEKFNIARGTRPLKPASIFWVN